MPKSYKAVVAIAFAAAVVLRLVTSAEAATNVTFQAETFSLPAEAGAVYGDASAGGGAALLVWSNATATRDVTTADITKLIVRAKGELCSGAPRMTVAVDGANVMTRLVKATRWTNYGVALSRPAGTHTIAISFTNDHFVDGSCDRNLHLDWARFAVTGTAPATPTPTPTPTPEPPPASDGSMYVDPNGPAKQQADQWRTTRPEDAAQMDKIAAQAQGFWFGDWSGDVRAAVNNVVSAASAAGKIPVLVAYNIPNRDCGLHSAGGVTPDQYRTWIRSFAEGIGARQAIVVIEPDALAFTDCLNEAEQSTRFGLLAEAVEVLQSGASTNAYIDAGHSRWLPASEAARRLDMAGIAGADGFSLNVSNFGWTTDEVAYGNQVSALVNGKHFVVDVGRNGAGPAPNNEWCNPPDRALGYPPTLTTGQALVDGYLWVKRPGESDGPCNGGPAAGHWWADYALGLAQRAAW